MKKWYEKIVAVHTAVTTEVSHGYKMKSDRYFVWQEDGSDDLFADNRHVEKTITGTTDLFTKMEFDPWREEFEDQLEKSAGISWSLNSIQYEHDTGFWHYEWVWSVSA